MRKKKLKLKQNQLIDFFDEEYAREKRRERRKNLNKRKYSHMAEDNEGISYHNRNWKIEIDINFEEELN